MACETLSILDPLLELWHCIARREHITGQSVFDIRITSFVNCVTCNVIPRGLSMASLLTSCHRKAESCPGPGAPSFSTARG